MKQPDRKFFPLFVMVAISFGSSASAQNKYWHRIKGKPLIKFDWNCASPETLPKSSLSQLIKSALKGEQIGPTEHFSDRAFAYDLNRDAKPEYFVPLNCGATGNCVYGVFTLHPAAKFLGKVGGEYVYLHGHRRAWPDLVTYGHFTVVEGTLSTYVFKRGRYQRLTGLVWTDSRGGIYGRKVPAFLQRARKACKTVGY